DASRPPKMRRGSAEKRRPGQLLASGEMGSVFGNRARFDVCADDDAAPAEMRRVPTRDQADDLRPRQRTPGWGIHGPADAPAGAVFESPAIAGGVPRRQ